MPTDTIIEGKAVEVTPATGPTLLAGIFAYLANQSKIWALVLGVLGYAAGMFGIGGGSLGIAPPAPTKEQEDGLTSKYKAELSNLQELLTKAGLAQAAAERARQAAEAALMVSEKGRKEALAKIETLEKPKQSAPVVTIDPVPEPSRLVIDPVPPKVAAVKTEIRRLPKRKIEPEPAKPACDPVGNLAQGRLPTC